MTSRQNITTIEQATQFQQKASDPDRSVWVSANAGSGKTYVLVNRIIRLMLDGALPEKIMCLTFTKAAAAEMSNRLFERLSVWVAFDDEMLAGEILKITGEQPSREELNNARKLFALSLETPGGLKIQTIHGFCESLLHRFPIEAGLTPGFDVLEESEAKALKQEARNAVLARAMRNREGALGGALSNIVARSQGDTFDQILDHILKGREKFIQNLDQTSLMERPDILTAQANLLREKAGLGVQSDKDKICEEFAGEHNFDREKYKAVIQSLNTEGKNDAQQADRLITALDQPNPQERFAALRLFFLTKTGEPRKPNSLLSKKAQETNPEITQWISGQQDSYVETLDGLAKIDFCQVNEELYLLADSIHASYTLIKQSRGKLDFDDLISHSCDLFKRVSGAWVLYKIDGGLDHILVDEAQDTSASQWQIISAIAEEFFVGDTAQDKKRTIFAVGDEKQSIYSFQGADPSQFDKMRSYFAKRAKQGARAFEKIPLSVSFRSTAQVLGLVDKVFENQDAAEGLTHSGDIDSHVPTRIGQAGLIELWDTIKPGEKTEPDPWDAPLDWQHPQSPAHLLAERIAQKIKYWLENKEILAAHGRPIEPGDILILVRRRKAFFEAMLRALKAHNIPVAGADRMALSEQIAVMDLVALGRVMLLPTDDLSLACVLKSPFFGVTEDELFKIAHGRGGVPLWQETKTKRPDLYETLSEWRNLARGAGVFDFYSHILSASGGRQKIVGRLGEEAHDPIDEFLSLALTYDQTGGTSLQEFIHRFSKSDITIKRDMEHGKNEVRLMTVHGAKGLEGNIVFLPETCDDPLRNAGRANLTSLPIDEDIDMPIWALNKMEQPSFIAEHIDGDKIASLAEYRRLLYVALTRARDRLYICGYETRDKKKDYCWYNLVNDAVLRADAQALEDDGWAIWRCEEKQQLSVDEKTAAQKTEPEGLPAWAKEHMPKEEYPPRPLVPSRLDWGESENQQSAQTSGKFEQKIVPPLSPKGQFSSPQLKRGTLIHQLLQYLPDLPTEDRREKARTYLASHAAELDAQTHSDMIEEVCSVLENKDFAMLFGPNSKAEVPISALIDPEETGGRSLAINGQIDRLVVGEKDVLIIDYKTSRPPPVKETDVPLQYLRQMAAYRLVLRKIYPDHNIKCVLLWTYELRLMPLSETVLENLLKQ